MRDPRITKLADVLVNYSTGVEAGQLVRISGPPVALPLLEAVYEQVVKAGAHPMVRCTPGDLAPILFKHAGDAQLDYLNPLLIEEMKTIDVSIGVWGETNTKSLSRTDPSRQARASAAKKPVFELFMNRAAEGDLKWTGTEFPTSASAQDAEMSLAEYEDFVLSAGHMDKDAPAAEWAKISRRQQKLVDYLTGKKQIRFQAPNGTDLTVNVEGMTWINCDGHENFPDGEVFTGPNLNAPDGGVNGIVRYTFPAVYHGREVHDIELTFEKGKVVRAEASKGKTFLEAMLDQDEGARFLGEIAIGTNYQITQYTKNTLFDEKIGGTFHAAVGAGYPETGNKNQSALHWDMVCDLRPAEPSQPRGSVDPAQSEGGTITVDGEIISRGGRFVHDDWPGHSSENT